MSYRRRKDFDPCEFDIPRCYSCELWDEKESLSRPFYGYCQGRGITNIPYYNKPGETEMPSTQCGRVTHMLDFCDLWRPARSDRCERLV